MIDITAPGVALCQDCLRVVPAVVGNDGVCPHCGGETCSCDGCTETITLLRSGCLDWRTLGLQGPITGWTEAGGVEL